MSNLMLHAETELKRVGYSGDADDELDRQIYHQTMKIVQNFADCGHSGYSAAAHTHIINQLLQFKPLSDLTTDPDEWLDVGEMQGRPCWQNKRRSDCFSEDRGKTYYSVNEFRTGWRRKLLGHRGKIYTSKPSGSY